MSGQSISFREQGATAWVTLDRAEYGNAPTEEMAESLCQICLELRQNDRVRVILITGAGNEFCVAVPTRRQVLDSEATPLKQGRIARLRVAAAAADIEKPVIAVVNGGAIGQGLELALACDLRIASEEARFGMPHGAVGMLPFDGGTQRLPRVVGQARALELLLTGREVDAREAAAMGLVHQVVPAGELAGAAQALADRVAACAPVAVRYAKEAVRQGAEMALEAGLRLEADLNIMLHSTEDRAEGIRSFRERREPRFQGA